MRYLGRRISSAFKSFCRLRKGSKVCINVTPSSFIAISSHPTSCLMTIIMCDPFVLCLPALSWAELFLSFHRCFSVTLAVPDTLDLLAVISKIALAQGRMELVSIRRHKATIRGKVTSTALGSFVFSGLRMSRVMNWNPCCEIS